ncbi:DUF1127 domain-containing protein [Rhodobacteraceae bacterium]|nr:DUF1127 domain-containing protein [Paracoccaceae bacterium]
MTTFTLTRRFGVRPILSVILLRWLERQKLRRQLRILEELPPHLLRDIGCEVLIRYRTDSSPYGF